MPTSKYKVSSQLVEIDVDAITVPDWARKIEREYLSESIEERGVIVPITVGKIRMGKDVVFILIDGYGRLQLAKEKGQKTIPARLIEIQSEEDALLLSIELELTKEPWSIEYMYNVIKELVAKGYKKTEIAKILKVPRSKIYRILKLDEVDEEVKEKVLQGEIPLRALDSEEQLQRYLHPEEEIEEAEAVPVGTEQKYIPASELEIPQETIEEVEVQIEEEEEKEEKKEEEEEEGIEEVLVNILDKTYSELLVSSESLYSWITKCGHYKKIDRVKKIYNLIVDLQDEIMYFLRELEE